MKKLIILTFVNMFFCLGLSAQEMPGGGAFYLAPTRNMARQKSLAQKNQIASQKASVSQGYMDDDRRGNAENASMQSLLSKFQPAQDGSFSLTPEIFSSLNDNEKALMSNLVKDALNRDAQKKFRNKKSVYPQTVNAKQNEYFEQGAAQDSRKKSSFSDTLFSMLPKFLPTSSKPEFGLDMTTLNPDEQDLVFDVLLHAIAQDAKGQRYNMSRLMAKLPELYLADDPRSVFDLSQEDVDAISATNPMLLALRDKSVRRYAVKEIAKSKQKEQQNTKKRKKIQTEQGAVSYQSAREKAIEKARQKALEKEYASKQIPQWELSGNVQQKTSNYSPSLRTSMDTAFVPRRAARRAAVGNVAKQKQVPTSKRQTQTKQKETEPEEKLSIKQPEDGVFSDKENEAFIEEDTHTISEYLSTRPNLQPDIPRGIQ